MRQSGSKLKNIVAVRQRVVTEPEFLAETWKCLLVVVPFLSLSTVPSDQVEIEPYMSDLLIVRRNVSSFQAFSLFIQWVTICDAINEEKWQCFVCSSCVYYSEKEMQTDSRLGMHVITYCWNNKKQEMKA